MQTYPIIPAESYLKKREIRTKFLIEKINQADTFYHD